MRYPTWHEVDMPELMVGALRLLRPGRSLDNLIHQIVFCRFPRAFVRYPCMACDHVTIPQQRHDEVIECQHCHSSNIYARVGLRFAKDSVPRYSLMMPLKEIFAAVSNAHVGYFGRQNREGPSYGWNQGSLYCQFPGGDLQHGYSARLCILQAALLCPYLWDKDAPWKRPEHCDPKVTGQHLTPLVRQACYQKPD